MKNKNSFIHNFIKVLFSQGLAVVSGIVVGFIIPKILGVTEYGLYRIYTMYFTYTSLLHFGFIDGILLKYAGTSYDDLNKPQVRTLTKFYITFQFIIGFIFVLSSFPLNSEASRFICMMLGVNLFITNITSYYQFISQATSRFTEFSLRNTVTSVVKVAIAFILVFVYLNTKTYIHYETYMILLSLFDLIMATIYVFTYKDITFGNCNHLKSETKTILSIFKTGITLTIAYQIGHLILVLDRQFISVLYDTNTYSVYAFAYNILSVFSTMIAVVSTVLLPMLKSMSKDEAISSYPYISKTVAITSAGALIGYYPITLIINLILHEYSDSISFLQIVFPSLLLSAAISVVGFTFFKTLNENLMYFFIGVGTLIFGFLTNCFAITIFNTPESISWASVLTMIVWYFSISVFLFVKYRIHFFCNFLYIISILCLFYACILLIDSIICSFVIYTISFCLLSFIFHKKVIIDTFARLVKFF